MATRTKVRAYVQWKDSSVFAGEEIECIISLKNECDDSDQQAPDDQTTSFRQKTTQRQRTVTHSTQQLSTVPSVAPSVAGSRAPSHRPTLSLSVYPPPSNAHQRVPSHAASNTTTTTTRHAPTHARSLSIMSMGSDNAAAPTSDGLLLAAVMVVRPVCRSSRAHPRTKLLLCLSAPIETLRLYRASTRRWLVVPRASVLLPALLPSTSLRPPLLNLPLQSIPLPRDLLLPHT
jgi:hypothetical protein